MRLSRIWFAAAALAAACSDDGGDDPMDMGMGGSNMGMAGSGMAGSGMAGSGMAGSEMGAGGTDIGAGGSSMGSDISFELDLSPLFSSGDGCLGCHDWGDPDQEIAYPEAVAFAMLILERVQGVGGSIMPLACGSAVGDGNCLSQEEVDLISDWIDAGTPP